MIKRAFGVLKARFSNTKKDVIISLRCTNKYYSFIKQEPYYNH